MDTTPELIGTRGPDLTVRHATVDRDARQAALEEKGRRNAGIRLRQREGFVSQLPTSVMAGRAAA